MQNDSIRKALADRYVIALLLIVGSLLLPLGCGEPGGPAYETLVITTASLPNAVPTVPYSETLVATGGDRSYTWSITVGSLPTGLSLTASTGIISGTPSEEGANTFSVQVASGDGQTDKQQLTITVEVPVLQPDELCSDYPHIAIATFEDANLEAVIRDRLSLGTQESLTCGLLSGPTELDANYRGITSLVGIQNLTSLTGLRLYDNSITDISALSGLTSLTDLVLGANSITDISALSALTSLTTLNLFSNSITGISALSALTNLTELNLDQNSITDVSALAGLTNLVVLNLFSNSITDISALSALTKLVALNLSYNPNLTDIQPLLDNPGLGAGDVILLWATNVSCADVAALQAKGLTVLSDCP